MTSAHMQSGTKTHDTELSLLEVIDFFQSSWKRLAAASLLGAVLALGGWIFLGNYSAEYVLLNNTINTINNTTNTSGSSTNIAGSNVSNYALDIVTWKTLQKILPNLAAQIIENKMLPIEMEFLYKTLSDGEWWQKNVVPSYAISKADSKDLAGIGKDLDGASTTILNLTISSSGETRNSAINNVRAVGNFLRTGGAFLQIQAILNGYEFESIASLAQLEVRVNQAQVEVEYLQARARKLEEMYKRFPGNGGAAELRMLLDAKDSGAKYLPIQTQIIATNNEINQYREVIERMNDRMKQLVIVGQFLDLALPLSKKTTDGLKLAEQLLKVEAELRKTISKKELASQAILDQIHVQLLDISARFTKGLEAATEPNAKKRGMIKSTALGFLVGFFLMLLILLTQKVWLNAKENDTQSIR